jgi:RNA polymerase sigma factor (sigma-70 family)
MTSGSRRQEIAEIYVRYGPTVGRRCRYLLRDPEAARDATQEVFVKVIRSIDTFRGSASPLAWVLSITTNHCLNTIASRDAAWRRRYIAQETLVREVAEESSGEDLIRAEQVRRLLGKLDEETQRVAIHYYVDEMTQEEIGEVLGRSLPTIRKRLAKFQRVAERELGHDLA